METSLLLQIAKADAEDVMAAPCVLSPFKGPQKPIDWLALFQV